MLAKQKQQALRSTGGMFGSVTKRFDGKDDKKVGVSFNGEQVASR